MSMSNINAAAAAVNALVTRVSGFVGLADAKIAAKEAQVDAFLDGATTNLTVGHEMVFDPKVFYAKDTVDWGVDPNDNTQTNWKEIQPDIGSYLYVMSPSYRAVVSLSQSFVLYPGYYEETRYALDKSASKIELIVAGTHATSEQINDALNVQDVSPLGVAFWGLRFSSHEVPILLIPGGDTGGRLYARFKNIRAPVPEVPVNQPPQEISGFGGNSILGVNSLTIYQK